MRITFALVISAVTLLVGIYFAKPILWLPGLTLAASIIDLLTRDWVNSNRLGANMGASAILKMACSLIGLCATIGQLACIVLLVWWAAA